MKTLRLLAPLFVSAFLANAQTGPAGSGGAAEPAAAPQPPAGAEAVDNMTEARPLLGVVAPRGGLSLGGVEIGLEAHGPGWSGIPLKPDPSRTENGRRAFEIGGARTCFRGAFEWTPQPDGSVRGHVEVDCVAPAEMQCLALSVEVPSPPPFGLGESSASEFELPLGDGRFARLSFPQAIRRHSQDSRPWGGQWTVRLGGHLGRGGTRRFAAGDRLVWDMALSAPDGIELTDSKPVRIAPNDDWAPLVYRKDIAPGSALDLSGQGLQDAPAGKHGWLRAVGGHFEFEGLPGVPQRLYGVNLCFSANYPTHEVADRLVDRFVRLGYNTVRIHHHDGAWAAAYASRESQDASRKSQPETCNLKPETCNPRPETVDDDIDRLDYLLARCFARGIYATTDLYVSRAAPWRDIGIDRDGNVPMQLYKTYVGIHDGAFADWCRWARAFLEHVNPYTGRAYAQDPGLPLVSLVNEGKLEMGWGGDKKGADPVVRAAWREFGGDGPNPAPPGTNAIDSPHDRFDAWINRRIWERCSAFVRSLGCRALLSNDNNGRWHGEGEGLTPLYDYVDSHFYVDHPVFIEKGWSLPSKCANANPVRAGLPAMLHRAWAKGSAKPYTITEWNFSGPGRYRGVGGILTGALAAEREWDGLWRFAYSHNAARLLDGPDGPGYFDCVIDPLIAASDRASVCLFLRGDAVQGAAAQTETRNPSALTLDKTRGSMAIVTARTCGGFAESGRIDAGPLSFELIPASAGVRGTASPPSAATPATLWASSLDGEPLERSSRILLTHLTDVQGDGTTFADASRRVITKWGKGCLVEIGEAEVELRLEDPAAFRVHALDTSGNRLAEIPADARGGALRFRVCTRGPDGSGVLYYEIAR